MSTRYSLALLLVAATAALTACYHPEPENIIDTIREAKKPNRNGGIHGDNAVAATAVKVEGVKTDHSFAVVERTSSLEKYPCNRCHTQPLAALQALRTSAESPMSHWQIELQHAGKNVMNCETCHSTGDMNELHLLNGQPVSFNASYQVCGQCHSKQLSDWVGGAHGKRVGGWAPPRVVLSCAGCHNPHSPTLSRRSPAQVAQVAYGPVTPKRQDPKRQEEKKK